MGAGQTDKTLNRQTEKLAEIAALATGRSAKSAPGFIKFSDAIYRTCPPEEILSETTESLYGAAFALWKFGARREPGKPRVRVYNPNPEEHGWESAHTVIDIITDDMPFLVDSITALVTGEGHGIFRILHPVIEEQRDAAHKRANGKGKKYRESVMHLQIERIGHAKMCAELEDKIRDVLADVSAAVTDWRAMLTKLRESIAELKRCPPKIDKEDISETVAFLEWLGDNHFTFLGYRQYEIKGNGKSKSTGHGIQKIDKTGLGLMRKPDFSALRTPNAPQVKGGEATRQEQAFFLGTQPVLVIKANIRSTIHRRVHLDYIGVKRFDKSGKVIGEHRFVGLFTSAAYNRSPKNIPFLRRKEMRIVERSGFAHNSHDGKALANVIETFPREELFQMTEDDLLETAVGILHLMTRPRTRVFIRRDQFERFVSALVYFPRELFHSDMRRLVGELIAETYHGHVSAFYPSFGDDALARIQFIIGTQPGKVPNVDIKDLEERIVLITRNWSDDLRDALIEHFGEARGTQLARTYANSFSEAYREAFPASIAISDVEKVAALSPDNPLALKFYRRIEDENDAVRLKLYRMGDPVPLSDCLPVLENLGMKVIEEHPYDLHLSKDAASGQVWIHDFLMFSRSGEEVNLSRLRGKLEEAFYQAWTGEIEDDALNRLVLISGLSARETSLLRAYARYLRQTGLAYSETYMRDTLCNHPGIAWALVGCFQAKFDPDNGMDMAARKDEAASLAGQIEEALEHVESLDEDRIIRRFLNAVTASLRTNYYRTDEDGNLRPYISFKLDSGAITDLPLPRPWREISIYAPWVEGIHLRGGPVARGGLRWSDRREDFRTEILGLVKAQQVKNAVIVPVGSKGGFFPKQLPAGGSRDEIQAEAIRSYKTFISGLLDITDNLDGLDVVPPARVIRHDTDDPYLVVAADKGTATFSDIANGLSAEYGFWLDDAFASGGSQGYDHKKMGITARGGWESVKRHFREMDHDTQSEPFTVIGVGDMSGDVFGNGMLLSDKIKLIAAFDHRDIFIDPDPDPAKTFKERQRLFNLPRSSWQDFSTKLISKGGGVFSRAAKSLTLTPEIKKITGIEADKVPPLELMQALLKSEADLLWFGGIGTYVKAAAESHADAGDRANDALRVDAEDLKVRVVGEGANLGITQKARIAFAQKGGRINSDAVDNSAGVDCSDHEVNIKIALGQVVSAGDMTGKQRNTLLAKMTDEVGKLVLETNYHQTNAISMIEARATKNLETHARFMTHMEKAGLLDRTVEELPDAEELRERAELGKGLTRPELSVLVAYAKMALFDGLLAGDAPDDGHMEGLLIRYFPGPLSKAYRPALLDHRLRREIIGTVLANAMVNQGGITYAHEIIQEQGATASAVGKAFVAVGEIFGLREIAGQINALDTQIPAGQQNAMHQALRDCLATQTEALLRHLMDGQSVDQVVSQYQPGLKIITSDLVSRLSPVGRDGLMAHARQFSASDKPGALDQRIAGLEFLNGALDIVNAAAQAKKDVGTVANVYFAVGSEFGLDWLRLAADGLEISDHWERLAVARIASDLRAQQRAVTSAVLASAKAVNAGKKPLDLEVIKVWAKSRGSLVLRSQKLIDELKTGGSLNLAKLAVAANELRSLVDE